MTGVPRGEPPGSGAAFRAWALERALPLWSDAGYDQKAGAFEEQLCFDRRAVKAVARRVMVQARQISVFSLAARRGWIERRQMALEAGASMIRRYWAADGAPGWVFALDRDGAIVDSRRDLYAHAFALFALAGLLMLEPHETSFREAVDCTVAYITEAFEDRDAGGCWDCLPRTGGMRRQNPHMHLLEAYLELFDATRDERFLDKAEHLVQLGCTYFINSDRGALRELFHDDWRVFPCAGQGLVEPGHQFEWAWLFRRYEDLTGRRGRLPVAALIGSALRHGTDHGAGRIIDEVGESGDIRKRSSRSWPHCEAIKSLSVETALGTGSYHLLIEALFERLLSIYCRPELDGGWIDHLDEQDRPLSTVMPASTLYHLMMALAEWERSLGAHALGTGGANNEMIKVGIPVRR